MFAVNLAGAAEYRARLPSAWWPVEKEMWHFSGAHEDLEQVHNGVVVDNLGESGRAVFLNPWEGRGARCAGVCVVGRVLHAVVFFGVVVAALWRGR